MQLLQVLLLVYQVTVNESSILKQEVETRTNAVLKLMRISRGESTKNLKLNAEERCRQDKQPGTRKTTTRKLRKAACIEVREVLPAGSETVQTLI